jgi:hypothetical protein
MASRSVYSISVYKTWVPLEGKLTRKQDIMSFSFYVIVSLSIRVTQNREILTYFPLSKCRLSLSLDTRIGRVIRRHFPTFFRPLRDRRS